MTDNHVPTSSDNYVCRGKRGRKLTRGDGTAGEVPDQRADPIGLCRSVIAHYVLYVTPVLNLYLEDMIEQVHDMVKNIPEVRMSRYYQPMQWLPHITLGKKLSKEQMQEAFAVMQEQFVPMEVTVSEIGLAKTNPHQDLVRIRIK